MEFNIETDLFGPLKGYLVLALKYTLMLFFLRPPKKWPNGSVERRSRGELIKNNDSTRPVTYRSLTWQRITEIGMG
jgi:hypothetical protein